MLQAAKSVPFNRALCENQMTETHFLNIDLDIESECEITQLVEELGRNLAIMSHHRIDDRNFASFETGESEILNIVEQFVTAISLLSVEASSIWSDCIKREFNFGFQAEDKPRSYLAAIPASVVKKLSELEAQIGITIYSPESR